MAYARRTAVERWFAYLKLGTRMDRFDIRVHGLAARSIMLAACALAVNLRLLDKHEQHQPAPEPAVLGGRVVWHPAATTRPQHRRRTTDPPPRAP